MNRTKNNPMRNTMLKATMIALALCVAGAGQAAAGEDAAGTIGAAQRYNNHSTNDADVILAVDETQDLLQNELFQRLMDDPKRAKDPEFTRILDNPNVYIATIVDGEFVFTDVDGKPRRLRANSLSALDSDATVLARQR